MRSAKDGVQYDQRDDMYDRSTSRAASSSTNHRDERVNERCAPEPMRPSIRRWRHAGVVLRRLGELFVARQRATIMLPVRAVLARQTGAVGGRVELLGLL